MGWNWIKQFFVGLSSIALATMPNKCQKWLSSLIQKYSSDRDHNSWCRKKPNQNFVSIKLDHLENLRLLIKVSHSEWVCPISGRT